MAILSVGVDLGRQGTIDTGTVSLCTRSTNRFDFITFHVTLSAYGTA